MMPISKQKVYNQHQMAIYEFFHYSIFTGIFIAFTYNKKQPPVFGTAANFWYILVAFFGLLFSHISNNLANYNVLTANAPFFYQISGTWSNHEGSILLWCWISSLYGFLMCYRSTSQNTNDSKRGGQRESLLFAFIVNFTKNARRDSPRYQDKTGRFQQHQFDTLFGIRTRGESKLSKRAFHGPATLDGTLDPETKKHFPILDEKRWHRSQETKRTQNFVHLAQDDKQRASSIHQKRIDGTLGIALFFFLFLAASSDPFVRNLFVRTEPLAESNPVSQDPILAIHPPCIYAGEVASAIAFVLSTTTMSNTIIALYAKKRKKHADQKNKTKMCYAACDGSQKMVNLTFKTLRAKYLVWTAGENTAICDQKPENLRIWILTAWSFLTVGILPGSWWAYHELGWGGWWFWDPVENASFMPRVLTTAAIHAITLPRLQSYTLLLNSLTFLACILGTFAIRSGVLASVHSFATDDTRGILLAWFLILMTAIASSLFYQIKKQAAVQKKYKKQIITAPKSIAHLRQCPTTKNSQLIVSNNSHRHSRRPL